MGRRTAPVSLRRAHRFTRCPAYYDTHRAHGATHHQALRALSNRVVGILDGCLRRRTTYDETTAWAHTARRPQRDS